MFSCSTDLALNNLPPAPRRVYKVGFCKPPKHGQFQTGQSGNPKGRPKGSKNKVNRRLATHAAQITAIVMEEAERKITVRDGDRMVKVSVLQAAIRSMGINAVKGHPGALRRFTDLAQEIDRSQKAQHEELVWTAIAYKIAWTGELERREKAGETGPEPMPHPDDIVVDLETGEIEICGPMTRDEMVEWNMARLFKAEHDGFLAALEAEAAKTPTDNQLRAMLARHRRLAARLAGQLGA